MFAERAREDRRPDRVLRARRRPGRAAIRRPLLRRRPHRRDDRARRAVRGGPAVCDLDLDAAAPRRATPASRTRVALARRAAVAILPGLPRRRGRRRERPLARLTEPIAPEEAEIYAALMLGLRDYVEKNGFSHVVLGLSGGIDSALVACLAADALGAERVSAAIMPSPYSSSATQERRARAGRRARRARARAGDRARRWTPTTRRSARARRTRARPDRGEPAGPDPWQPADGALQQVRLARAHDRQQVGDVGRLHHALRRPRRRLRRDQGRAEDARLPPV